MDKVVCELCGGLYTPDRWWPHERTKRHQHAIEEKDKIDWQAALDSLLPLLPAIRESSGTRMCTTHKHVMWPTWFCHIRQSDSESIEWGILRDGSYHRNATITIMGDTISGHRKGTNYWGDEVDFEIDADYLQRIADTIRECLITSAGA